MSIKKVSSLYLPSLGKIQSYPDGALLIFGDNGKISSTNKFTIAAGDPSQFQVTASNAIYITGSQDETYSGPINFNYVPVNPNTSNNYSNSYTSIDIKGDLKLGTGTLDNTLFKSERKITSENNSTTAKFATGSWIYKDENNSPIITDYHRNPPGLNYSVKINDLNEEYYEISSIESSRFLGNDELLQNNESAFKVLYIDNNYQNEDGRRDIYLHPTTRLVIIETDQSFDNDNYDHGNNGAIYFPYSTESHNYYTTHFPDYTWTQPTSLDEFETYIGDTVKFIFKQLPLTKIDFHENKYWKLNKHTRSFRGKNNVYGVQEWYSLSNPSFSDYANDNTKFTIQAAHEAYKKDTSNPEPQISMHDNYSNFFRMYFRGTSPVSAGGTFLIPMWEGFLINYTKNNSDSLNSAKRRYHYYNFVPGQTAPTISGGHPNDGTYLRFPVYNIDFNQLKNNVETEYNLKYPSSITTFLDDPTSNYYSVWPLPFIGLRGDSDDLEKKLKVYANNIPEKLAIPRGTIFKDGYKKASVVSNEDLLQQNFTKVSSIPILYERNYSIRNVFQFTNSSSRNNVQARNNHQNSYLLNNYLGYGDIENNKNKKRISMTKNNSFTLIFARLDEDLAGYILL